MDRPYIEVYCSTSPAVSTSDPIELFVTRLKKRYGGSEQTKSFNKDLLNSLVTKGYIPKSSIVWRHDQILKIFDFRIGEDGKIEYVIPCRPSPKKVAPAAEQDINIDIKTIKNAISRSKQMAV